MNIKKAIKSYQSDFEKVNFFKALKTYQNIEKPLRIEWIMLFSIITILLLSYLYWDIVITTRHGINLWNSLLNGRLTNFYLDNVNPVISKFNSSHAVYPFPVYMIFAIWNFPLWIMETFFKFDPFLSTWALLYAKLILLPFLLGCTYMVSKICKALSFSEKNEKWCMFYFASSSLIFYSLLIKGQYDIFSMFFTLVGIYYYIKGNIRRFIVYFSIAIALKYFALLVFIPLVLLYEKRILKIIFYFICGFSICLFLSPIFAMPDVSKNSLYNFIIFIFINNFPFMDRPVPIFIVITVILWIACYIKKPVGKIGNLTIYIAFLSMAIFFLCSKTYFYWIILLSPYVCILCFANKKYSKTALLIEILFSTAFSLIDIVNSPFISLGTINDAILPKLFGEVGADKMGMYFGGFLKDILKNDKIFVLLSPICAAIFAAGIIMFAVINLHTFIPLNSTEDGVSIPIYKDIIATRLIINVIISSLPILVYFIKK